MNPLYDLSGNISAVSGTAGVPFLKNTITLQKLKTIKTQLEEIALFWRDKNLFDGVLLDVVFSKIIPKSDWIQKILCLSSSSDEIRGIRYSSPLASRTHIFTFFLTFKQIEDAIKNLGTAISIVDFYFGEKVRGVDICPQKPKLQQNPTQEETEEYQQELKSYELRLNRLQQIDWKTHGLSKSALIRILIDSQYVDRMTVTPGTQFASSTGIISLYNTNLPNKELFTKLGIESHDWDWLDEHTVLLSPHELQKLKKSLPNIICMGCEDEITLSDETEYVPPPASKESNFVVEDPTDEAIIGVLDTGFDTSCYFSRWVTYENKISSVLDENITEHNRGAFSHGTFITSILHDGPRFNPDLEDGCGKFRVKHFAVATGKNDSLFTITSKIIEAVKSNPQIKVWNLSLGADEACSPDSISFLASILDKLQSQYNVLFIVPGTNQTESSDHKFIGSPADSVNAICVNSVRFNKFPATYSREGRAEHGSQKPDLSYFGGDSGEEIYAYFKGIRKVKGTSFAAPWIARKAAFLIHYLFFTPQMAKAFLLDSAVQWNLDLPKRKYLGYGVVPKRIEDVLSIKDDEIKICINVDASKHNNYMIRLPVPSDNDIYPYVAKAVLCYFPNTERRNGVDYTCTEVDVKIGRTYDEKSWSSAPKLKTINFDTQGEGALPENSEKNSRKLFQKWNNSKVILERFSPRTKGKKTISDLGWGINFVKIGRTSNTDSSIQAALLLTLKELKGRNRTDKFYLDVQKEHLLVKKIDIESQINLIHTLDQHISLS